MESEVRGRKEGKERRMRKGGRERERREKEGGGRREGGEGKRGEKKEEKVSRCYYSSLIIFSFFLFFIYLNRK